LYTLIGGGRYVKMTVTWLLGVREPGGVMGGTIQRSILSMRWDRGLSS